jgi:uncharacterized membrane protein YoaK (UPF0700 family)
MVLEGVAVLAIAAILFALVGNAIKRGVVGQATTHRRYDRFKEPDLFWLSILLRCVVPIIFSALEIALIIHGLQT